jgi:hypothetical protein
VQDWVLGRALAIDPYDLDAPQPAGFGGRRDHPRILFPNLTRWEQLVAAFSTSERLAPYVVQGSEAHTPTERRRGDTEIGPFCTMDLSKASGPHHASVWIRAHDSVYRALATYMLMIRGDHIGFHIVAWTPTTALVYAQYGLILGAEWVAMIDPNTIPQEVRDGHVHFPNRPG